MFAFSQYFYAYILAPLWDIGNVNDTQFDITNVLIFRHKFYAI